MASKLDELNIDFLTAQVLKWSQLLLKMLITGVFF